MSDRGNLVHEVEGMPWSLEAERALLSCVLLEPDLLDEYANLRDGYFYFPAHQVIFRAMLDMRAAGKLVDMVTVTQVLGDDGSLAEVGGAAAIGELFALLPTGANAPAYAEIVREKAARRRIISTGMELVRRGRMADALPEELLHEADTQLMALRAATGEDSCWQHIGAGILQASDQIEATYKNRGKILGLATGINDFDRMTNGLRPGQLMVVAARPGMGKTCFVLQAARNFAKEGPVAIFSLEMNMVELASRLICSETPLNLGRLRDGFMGKNDLPMMTRAMGVLAGLGVFVDETPALSVLDLRSRARQAVVKKGARAIFVDYLQLIKGSSKRAMENRALEVAEISMALKAMAKELKVPVVAAAQLNRDAENRAGAPKLADLRESGQIEQDADIVVFLHRPKKDSKDASEREEMLLQVAKHRDGPVGPVPLRFVGEYARFENLTEDLYSNNPERRQGYNG